MRIGIIGGGIGGLTAALALSRDGHSVTVLERAERLAPIGAGIALSPNGTAVLRALGVDVAPDAVGFQVMEARDGGGRLLLSSRVGDPEVGNPLCLTRGALHVRLGGALGDRVELRLGAAVTGVTATEDGCVVTTDRDDRFDLVVGADGLRSVVRSGLGTGRLRYSGQTCWRWQAPFEMPVGRWGRPAVEWWAPGRRAGAFQLPDGEGYHYLVADAAEGASGPASIDGLRELFRDLPDAVRLLASLDRMPDLHHDLVELDRPVWGRGRIVLLGDAAHAMTPNLGMGAVMAIEDAAALAVTLREGVGGVLERYVAIRARRVRQVQLMSRYLGRIGQSRSPAGRRLRDGLLRVLPQGSNQSQYRASVAPGLALAAQL